MTETLREKQSRFTLMIGALIVWAFDHGYELTFGEAHRPQELADLYATKGKGISNSLHILRLAVDFNLFINGRWQTTTEAFRPLGQKWKELGGTWGGDFKKPDGNHFSLEHEGVR
jgi:hypothetical protein